LFRQGFLDLGQFRFQILVILSRFGREPAAYFLRAEIVDPAFEIEEVLLIGLRSQIASQIIL